MITFTCTQFTCTSAMLWIVHIKLTHNDLYKPIGHSGCAHFYIAGINALAPHSYRSFSISPALQRYVLDETCRCELSIMAS